MKEAVLRYFGATNLCTRLAVLVLGEPVDDVAQSAHPPERDQADDAEQRGNEDYGLKMLARMTWKRSFRNVITSQLEKIGIG